MAASGFRGELVGTPPGLPWQRLQDLTPETEVGGEPIERGRTVRTLLDEPDADWAVRQIRRNMPRLELQRTEMRKAFAETFPNASLRDVVECHSGRNWAEAKPT